jgi:hypothetical protein
MAVREALKKLKQSQGQPVQPQTTEFQLSLEADHAASLVVSQINEA